MKLPPGGQRYVDRGASERLFGRISACLNGADYPCALGTYKAFWSVSPTKADVALLGLADRYFLLVEILRRIDALHPWIFERCREVEAEPDGYLDLWARTHYKSTIITFAGIIQEVLRNPELTVGIFSHTRPDAKDFLRQIKNEFEGNEELKAYYSDVLWNEPKKDAQKWSEDDGIIIKRESNPKESTVQAHGLIDGMPTGSHFGLRVYDDVVTEKAVTTPEMVRKVTEMRDLSNELGTIVSPREWNIGTRYHFADSYQSLLDRRVLKPRIYPATHDATATGRPVLLTQKAWDKKVHDTLPKTLAAQQFMNPAAGQNSSFEVDWLSAYEQRPRTLHVYIVADPSKRPSANQRTDRTAIAVWGIDSQWNRYLLDGVRHKMDLHQRWEYLRNFHRHWSRQPGVQFVQVGYEQYGMQSDNEHFELCMRLENYSFSIEIVAWPRSGGASKTDRVERLGPVFKKGLGHIPYFVWHDEGIADKDGKIVHDCYWTVVDKKVVYWPLLGQTKVQRKLRASRQDFLLASQIKRRDENNVVYDVTRAFIEEWTYFPFGTHDDFVDASSRVEDLEPSIPQIVSQRELEPGVYVDT